MKWKSIRNPLILCLLAVMAALAITACAGGGGGPQKLRRSCTECHHEYKEQFSSGNVHQPVREDNCQSCHRNHGVIGAVLLREEEPALCFKCHREVAETFTSRSELHQPFRQGQCDDCHARHQSEHPFLLHQSEEELCFSCHDPSLTEGQFVHQPVTEGCNTCHAAHGSASPSLLPRPGNEICADCHQTGEKAFVARHGGYAVTGGCLDCHNVHSSNRESLLRNASHSPMAQQECQSCHLPPSQHSLTPLAEGADLCLQCHSRGNFDAVEPHLDALDGDCSQCHAVHASDHRGMVKSDPGSLCLSCHDFNYIEKEGKRSLTGAHAPAAERKCLECHRPHQAGQGQNSLLIRPAEELCQKCHSGKSAPKAYDHPPAREGNCLLCHASHESPVSGLLVSEQQELCLQCHVDLEDQKGRLSLHRPFVNGDCASCHDPHGGLKKTLLTGSVPQSCGSCHQGLETQRQKPGMHVPFREGRCDLCHVPHSSDQPALLSRSIDGLCLSCHDELSPRPGAPEAHDNCAVCHVSHGNEGDFFLRQSLPELCVSCHDVDAFWEEGVGHSPASDGECATCHDPHFADGDRVVPDQWTGALCDQCHETAPEALQPSHGGIAPGPDSCRTCHDPHGGADRSLTFPVKHQPFAEGECAPCHKGGNR